MAAVVEPVGLKENWSEKDNVGDGLRMVSDYYYLLPTHRPHTHRSSHSAIHTVTPTPSPTQRRGNTSRHGAHVQIQSRNHDDDFQWTQIICRPR